MREAGANPGRGAREYQIAWRDLAKTTPMDAVRELLLPLPWLVCDLLPEVSIQLAIALASVCSQPHLSLR